LLFRLTNRSHTDIIAYSHDATTIINAISISINSSIVNVIIIVNLCICIVKARRKRKTRQC